MRNRIKFLITITLLCVLAVMLYYHFSNKNNDNSNNNKPVDETVISEVDKIISKDIETNYPLTAREVLTLFTRIQKCYYNEEIPSDKLVSLIYKTTEIFDDELNANNPFDEYYAEVQDEIRVYKENERTISRIIIDKSSDIVYSTIDGIKYASINCIYYVKTNKGTTKTVETYVLRKDEEEHWKILGWKLYEKPEE